MRRLGLFLAFALAGCGGGGERQAEERAMQDDPRGRIACIPPGESEFREVCRIDRVVDASGIVLTLTLPDGGFRRVRVDPNGGGLTAADGVEAVVVGADGGQVEAAIGGARFRLPAVK